MALRVTTTKVVPLTAAATKRFRADFTAWLTKCYDAWNSTQLLHIGGKYSIKRMLALEEYSRTTSLARVVLVTTRLPVAVFAVVVCQEAVPLQDPREGWQANYGFWVRVGFLGVAAAYTVTAQAGPLLGTSPLSYKQPLVYCSCTGGAFVALGVALSAASVFPVQFFVLSLSMVSALVLGASLRAVLGAEARRRISSQRTNWLRFCKLTVVNGWMCAGYPAYQVLFTKANRTPYELPVLLILPALTIVLKLLIMSVASPKEDMIPELVVFTVNFFDILYLATFMQTISSTTMAVIIAIDCFHSATSLFSLHGRTQAIASNLRAVLGPDIPVRGKFDLLDSVRILCKYPRKFYNQLRPDIRIRACISHRLSSEGADTLKTLEKHILYSSSHERYHVISQGRAGGIRIKRNSVRLIQPQGKKFIHSSTVAIVTRLVPDNAEAATQDNCLALHEALEALFTSECLVLAEYVELWYPSCTQRLCSRWFIYRAPSITPRWRELPRITSIDLCQESVLTHYWSWHRLLYSPLLRSGIVGFAHCISWHLCWRRSGL